MVIVQGKVLTPPLPMGWRKTEPNEGSEDCGSHPILYRRLEFPKGGSNESSCQNQTMGIPKTMASRLHIICVVSFVFCLSGVTSASPTILDSKDSSHANRDLVEELFNKVQTSQNQKDETSFPWFKAKGVYESSVKLNFHGKPSMAEARRMLEVYDNNMFTTAWVTSALLEAYKYGQAPRPSDHQISLALEVIEQHKDKNKPYDSSLRFFWPLAFNKTLNFWQSTPVNLLEGFKLAEEAPISAIEKFLDLIGLKELAKDIESIVRSKDMYLHAFHIPPDMDDTFVNLGLGSLLYSVRDEFPQGWQQWKKDNSNITSVFDALKRYAYRPFSKDPNVNSIDPRTYMYIRSFLDQADARGEDLALVATWAQDLTELRREYDLGVAMPFQINNVDVTVAANTIYGITAAVLSGLVEPSVLEDPQIAQIYLNTSSLIAYQISTNYSGRPELALTYYPSVFDFSWFVARIVAIQEEARTKGPLPSPVMEASYQQLKTATQGPMTQFMLSNAKHEGEESYYDDFLGDGDLELFTNKTLVRGEDRIFSTAGATNALMYIWTLYNQTSGQSSWRPETPTEVKKLVGSTIAWLNRHALDWNLKPWNAFFSGSAKGPGCMPFWYPVNRCEFLNGTKLDTCSSWPRSRAPTLFAMQGHVPKDQFDAMIKEKHFGHSTPLAFHGYNSAPGFFPLWSSASYTHVTSMLALARHRHVQFSNF